MIILKIGGSILTNKDSKTSEVDAVSLKRIASEIKRSLDNSDKELVIVHGAGSFGHPPAKKHKIGEEFDESEYPQKRLGFCEIQNEVKKLNMFICVPKLGFFYMISIELHYSPLFPLAIELGFQSIINIISRFNVNPQVPIKALFLSGYHLYNLNMPK